MAQPFDDKATYTNYDYDRLYDEMRFIDDSIRYSQYHSYFRKIDENLHGPILQVIRGFSYDVEQWDKKGRDPKMLKSVGNEIIRLRELYGIPSESVPAARKFLAYIEGNDKFRPGNLSFDSFFDSVIERIAEYDEQREEEEQQKSEELQQSPSFAPFRDTVNIDDSLPIEEDYIYDQAKKTLESLDSPKGQEVIQSFRDTMAETKDAVIIIRAVAEELMRWRSSRQWGKRDLFLQTVLGRLKEYKHHVARAAFRLYGDIFVACKIPYEDVYISIRDVQTAMFKKEEEKWAKKKERHQKEQEEARKREQKLPYASAKFAKSVVDPDIENADWVESKIMFLYRMQNDGFDEDEQEEFKKRIHASVTEPDFRIRKADSDFKNILQELEANHFTYSKSLGIYSSRNWGFDVNASNLENGDNYRQGYGYHPDNIIKRGLFLKCYLDVRFMLDKSKLTFKDFMESMFSDEVIDKQRVFVSPPGSGKDIMLRWFCLQMKHDTDEKVVFQFRTLEDLDKFHFDLMAERAIGRLPEDITVLPLTARHTYSEKEVQSADILLTTHQRIIGETPKTVYMARVGGSKESGKTRYVKRIVFINELPPTHVRYKLKNEERIAILTSTEGLAKGGRDELLHAWREDQKNHITPYDKNSHLRAKCEEISSWAFSICCEELDIQEAAHTDITEGKKTKKNERTKLKIKKLEEQVKAGKALKYTAADALNAETFFASISRAVKGSSSSATPLSKAAGRRRFAMFGGIIAAQVAASVFGKDRDFSSNPLSELIRGKDANGMATYEIKLNIPDPVYFPFDEVKEFPVCIIDGTGDITFRNSGNFTVIKPKTDAVKRVLNLSDKVDIIPDTETDRRIRREDEFFKALEKYDHVIERIRSVCSPSEKGLVLTPMTLKFNFMKRASKDEAAEWRKQQTLELQTYISGKTFLLSRYLYHKINQGLETPICDVVYYQSGMERSTSRFQDVRHLFYITEFFQNKAAWKLHKKAAGMEREGIVTTEDGKEVDLSLIYPSVAAMVQCYYRTAARKVDNKWKDIKDTIILSEEKEQERADRIYPELWYEGKRTIPHQDMLIDTLDGVSCYDITQTTEYLKARKKILRQEAEESVETDTRGIHIYFTEDFQEFDAYGIRTDSMIGSFLSAFDEVRYRGQPTDSYRIWDAEAMRVRYGLKKSLERRDSYNKYCSLLLETDILSGELFSSESLGLQQELTGKPIRNLSLSNGIIRVLSHLAESAIEPFVLLQNQKRGKDSKFLITKKSMVMEKTNSLDEYGNLFHVVNDPSGKNPYQNPKLYEDILTKDYQEDIEKCGEEGRQALAEFKDTGPMDEDERLLRMENPKQSVSELLRELMDAGALKSFVDTPILDEEPHPDRRRIRRNC